MRYGYCVFCDDIRTEAGEKLSFMGCYNGVMIVPSQFPFSLPKFCAHVTLVTSADEPYDSIILRCYAPGEEHSLIEERLDTPNPDEQEGIVATLCKDGAPPASIVVAASIIFSPLKIREPGLISVRAIIDGEPNEVNIASLQVLGRDT